MARILVVDDEKSIRITFKTFLENENHIVYTADNVKTAIEILENNEIDLVLTDIIMPQNTGIELLKIIKKTKPTIAVVIMTGEPTIKTASESVKSSANDYITKPIDKVTLLNVVKQQLYQKGLIDNQTRLEKENKEYKNNLEKLVEERTLALKKAMNSTIVALSSIVELRDSYTAEHQKSVGNLAVEIAHRMGIKRHQLECVYVAGYLHDIGKIAIPAEILSKPGKLSELEFEIIKTHVENGFKILNEVELPWPVAEVVLQHHERNDGSGYPNSIKEKDIRIEAKILAVADVIEAMSSHRPYRPSLGLKFALEEISNNKGVKFDEIVVNVAIELFKEDNYKINDNAKELIFEI